MPYFISGNKKIQLRQSSRHSPLSQRPDLKSRYQKGLDMGLPPALLPQVLEDPAGTLLMAITQVDADLGGLEEPQSQQLLKKCRARLVRRPSAWHPFHVLSPVDGDPFRVANALAEQEGLTAQPRLLTLVGARPAPVEPEGAPQLLPQQREELLERQWGLRLINAPQAWALTQGRPDVKVAVIDCGVDLEHLDLRANLVDQGYDILKRLPSAAPDPLNQANAHGTACAGIICATGTHALGVAPGCQLLPIRFVQFEYGGCWYEAEHLAEAIRRAVALGASVISISFATWESEVVRRAIQHALSAKRGSGGTGCVVVAGTGNGNGPVRYPAACPGVLAVAAVDLQGKRWRSGAQGSCFGAEVSVAAPGTAIWTTDLRGDIGYTMTRSPQGDYAWDFEGTSAACAFAAGAAALVLSAAPQLSAGQACHLLQETASKPAGTPFPGGRNDEVGHGVINARAAVEGARGLPQDAVV